MAGLLLVISSWHAMAWNLQQLVSKGIVWLSALWLGLGGRAVWQSYVQ
jgi:hypothetical protein